MQSWFFELDFNDVESPEQRERLNDIPTSFILSDEQIDTLIATGQGILNADAGFQDMLAAIGTEAARDTGPVSNPTPAKFSTL